MDFQFSITQQIYSSSFNVRAPRDRIIEITSELHFIDAKVFCIAEESDFRNATPWFLLPHHVVRNELATQHLVPKRKFFCLTNAGLRVLVKNRPVDELYELLVHSDGRDSLEIRVRKRVNFQL